MRITERYFIVNLPDYPNKYLNFIGAVVSEPHFFRTREAAENAVWDAPARLRTEIIEVEVSYAN